MAHQIHQRQWSNDVYGIQSKGSPTRPEGYRRPETASPRRPHVGNHSSMTSISLLASPRGPVHLRQNSFDVFTPVTAVESVFDPPLYKAYSTPLSSTYSPSIAELEDTSPQNTYATRVSPDVSPIEGCEPCNSPNPNQESPIENLNTRALDAIENIIAIEQDNRILRERAMAAEEAAEFLREQNLTLQCKFEACAEQNRPTTAPSQLHQRRTANENTTSAPVPPIIPLDIALAKSPTPTRTGRLSPLPPSKPLSPPSHDIAPDPFTAKGFPTTRRVGIRPPIIRIIPGSEISEISSPIPGSVVRHQVTYEGAPLSSAPPVPTISLAEAQRRDKPLPPLGSYGVPNVSLWNRTDAIANGNLDPTKKRSFIRIFKCGKKA